jgi:predicted CopG family antitoxin
MATKTIGIKEEVYDRLAAEKHEDESFTETVDRLLDKTQSDWREGFGRYSGAEGDEFEQNVLDSKRGTSIGMSHRTDEVLEAIGFELDDQGNILEYPDDEDGSSEIDEGR